jgi:putative heme-binding domain-containing protein
MYVALNGRRDLKAPQGWPAAYAKLKTHSQLELREEAARLALIFGDASAFAELMSQAANAELPAALRNSALASLSQSRLPEVLPLLKRAVSDPALRATAIRSLAGYEDPEVPALIINQYAKLSAEEKAEAINTLASRANYAVALLEAVRERTIPARDITPFSVRQLQSYKDSLLEPLLRELGSVRGVSSDKAAQVRKLKELLTPSAVGQADLSRGRAVFQRACAACHTLFDAGGTLAPELTGSQRSNLDYLLENILDPNAVVWDRYKATYFETKDDRLISGVIMEENEGTVTIQTQTGTVTLPRNEIVSRNQSNLSMMPEGLLDTLEQSEIVDLIAYLQSPSQVPLPANTPTP